MYVNVALIHDELYIKCKVDVQTIACCRRGVYSLSFSNDEPCLFCGAQSLMLSIWTSKYCIELWDSSDHKNITPLLNPLKHKSNILHYMLLLCKCKCLFRLNRSDFIIRFFSQNTLSATVLIELNCCNITYWRTNISQRQIPVG